jgi:hypothetical protein
MPATCYVDPVRGSDTSPGTIGSPFQTLPVARDWLRGAGAGSTCVLRGGVYYPALPSTLAPQGGVLTFDARDSHTTYQAYPGETPIISAGIPITGWQQVGSTNQWSAPMPAHCRSRLLDVGTSRYGRTIRQVGKPTLYPTMAGLDPTVPVPPPPVLPTKCAGYGYDRALALETLRNPWDIRLASVGAVYTWRNSYRWLFGILPNSICVLSNLQYTRAATGQQYPSMIENVYEWLVPGTAYLDRSSWTWYLLPLAQHDLSGGTTSVRASVLDHVGVLTGVTGLTFSGITFMDTNWQAGGDPLLGYDDNVRGSAYSSLDYSPQTTTFLTPPHALEFVGCSGCKVTACTFRLLGGGAILFHGASANCSAIGNLCVDCDSAGITIADNMEGVAPVQTSRITVENNLITRVGQVYQDCCGIMASCGRGHRVRYNLVYNVPYDGIGWGIGAGGSLASATYDERASGDDIISYNLIHDSMTPLVGSDGIPLPGLNDGGAIYVNNIAAGMVIAHNWLHHTNNPFPGGTLYLDNRTFGISVHGNAIHDSLTGFTYYLNTPSGNCVLYGDVADTATMRNQTYLSNPASASPIPIATTPRTPQVVQTPLILTNTQVAAYGALLGAGLQRQWSYLTGLV